MEEIDVYREFMKWVKEDLLPSIDSQYNIDPAIGDTLHNNIVKTYEAIERINKEQE